MEFIRHVLPPPCSTPVQLLTCVFCIFSFCSKHIGPGRPPPEFFLWKTRTPGKVVPNIFFHFWKRLSSLFEWKFVLLQLLDTRSSCSKETQQNSKHEEHTRGSVKGSVCTWTTSTDTIRRLTMLRELHSVWHWRYQKKGGAVNPTLLQSTNKKPVVCFVKSTINLNRTNLVLWTRIWSVSFDIWILAPCLFHSLSAAWLISPKLRLDWW